MSAFRMGYDFAAKQEERRLRSELHAVKSTLQRYITADTLAEVRLGLYGPTLIDMYDPTREYTRDRTRDTATIATEYYVITVKNTIDDPHIRLTATHDPEDGAPEGLTIDLDPEGQVEIFQDELEQIKNWIIHAITGVPVDLNEHERNYHTLRNMLPPVERVLPSGNRAEM